MSEEKYDRAPWLGWAFALLGVLIVLLVVLVLLS